MGKTLRLFLSAILISLSLVAPATADDARSAKDIFLAPFSLVAGCAVGTPVAMARRTKSCFGKLMSALSEDNNSYKFWGAGCALVVAVPVGALEGIYFGPKNAIASCADKPFSKSCFSLGDQP